MANKKYIVKLDVAERARLTRLTSKGRAPAKSILKARILLKADQADGGEAWKGEQNCAALDTNVAMVARVREVFIEQGIEALTLTRKKRETPPILHILDGEAEAKLIALACSTPPEGCARWTLRLLRRTWSSARSFQRRTSIPLRGRKKANSSRT